MPRITFKVVVRAVAVVIALWVGFSYLTSGAVLEGAAGHWKGQIERVRALLDESAEAHARHDITLEKMLLTQSLTADGAGSDLAEIQRRLARLNWKFHKRYEVARQWLGRAEALGEDVLETHLENALLSLEAHDFARARTSARQALEAAATVSQKRRALAALGRASAGEVVWSRLDRGGSFDRVAARKSFAKLQPVVQNEPGDLGLARSLLTLALVLDEGPTAGLAWRAYYHVADGGRAPNLVGEAGLELDSIVKEWTPDNPLSEEKRNALIKALANSRFFSEAAVVALDPGTEASVSLSAEVRQIVGYARFCRQVKSITREHYRQTALDKASLRLYRQQLAAVAKSLWPHLLAPKPARPSPSESSLENTLTEVLGGRFGTYFSLGETAGYYDLHMGHSVVDVTRSIEQYGKKVELHFVALDSMVSNGFQSWAWRDGQHGGWNKPGVIYQVRTAYASGPLRAWRQVAEGPDRTEVLEDIKRETLEDQTRASLDPAGYLPGLQMRLLHQGRDQLLARLKDQDLQGTALRLSFLDEYRQAVLESSIFAHEGRHAIDKLGWLSFLSSDATTEFNAKLSEVAFAPEPRLALGAIFSNTIGSHTPHGQANQQIMKGLVGWMKEHSHEIPRMDHDRPLLPQFDLLSDAQIRSAFQSLDPMAR